MPETHRGTVLSLGSINADFQMRVDQAPGSASMLPAHDLVRLSGGKAANVAVQARRLGCPARLYGRVGDDDLAAQALAPLEAEGVDLSGVARGGRTGVAVVLVPPSGKKQIILAGRANDDWSEAEIEALVGHIRRVSAPAILVADYEVPAAVVRRAAAAAQAQDIPVVIDPSHPQRAEREVLGRAHALTPNEDEARRLAGARAGDDPEAVARTVAQWGAAIVCLKLDGGGCLVAIRGQEGASILVPSSGPDIVDTTGAGDAFTGALAVALLEGRRTEEAALFAVAASELAVTAYGSQPSYAERERIEAHAALLQCQLRSRAGR